MGLCFSFCCGRDASDEDTELLERPLQRTMSFTSSSLLVGSFPPEANVAKPIINAAVFFRKCPPLSFIKDAARKGFASYDRFRCTPVKDERTGCWGFEDRGTFCNDSQFSTITVANEDALLEELNTVIMTDIPGYHQTPAWHIRRIENTSRQGLSVIVFRVHHVIGDGISLVAAMGSIFTDKYGGSANVDLPENIRNRIQQLKDEQTQKSCFSLVPEVISSAIKVLSLTASSYDSDICFTSPNKRALTMTPRRRVIFFPTVRLNFVKSIKNKAKVTVNDILLTAVSGAIRRYCESLGCSEISNNPTNRALIPVAFPRTNKGMRNSWSFVSTSLPVGKNNCIERLQVCNEEMTQLKRSPDAAVQLWIQSNILPILPTSISQTAALDLFKRHSLVFSNLPGPDKTQYFAGEAIVGFQILFPNLIPQVIILSYNGGIFMNMIIDPDVVTRVDRICEFYVDELRLLAFKFRLPSVSDLDLLCPTSHIGATLSAV